jgi:hypothetical protein
MGLDSGRVLLNMVNISHDYMVPIECIKYFKIQDSYISNCERQI